MTGRVQAERPLIERSDKIPMPPTWCMVVCEQGCQESWLVDVADFDPRPTLNEVQVWLTPYLIEHEHEHRRKRGEPSVALHEWMSTEVPCADCATGWHEAVKCVNDSCPCDGDGLALGVPHSRPS